MKLTSWWIALLIFLLCGIVIRPMLEVLEAGPLVKSIVSGLPQGAWGLFVGWKMWGERGERGERRRP